MATIIKGKLKGQQVKIHQWCNDWFVLENGKVFSPTSLQLTPEERDKVLSHNNNGFLLKRYALQENGIFKKNLRRGYV